MKNQLSHLDRRVRAVVVLIGKQCEQNGCQAYLVGGFVRDMVLKRRNFDVDIVIEGTVSRIIAELSKKLKAKVTVHKRFGTAVVRLAGGFRVDLATARKESYRRPGALPDVTRGRISDDLQRRDFTVNTLAIAINPRRSGEVLDLFNGRRDLRQKNIRILHEQSFLDDPTRILRAVRFEQRLGFRIEPKSLALLKTALEKKMIDYVKPPRYFEEFKKTLEEAHPAKHLRRLYGLGGLNFVSTRFRWEVATARLIKKLEAESRKFQKAFPGKDLELWTVYFAALILQFRSRDQEKICRRFQISNAQQQVVLGCCAADKVIKKLSAGSLSSSEVYRVLRPLSCEILIFLKARSSAQRVHRRIRRFLQKHDAAKLDIDGFDVQKMGVPRGAKIGAILKSVLDAKINGHICSRQDELRLAKELSLSLN